MDSAVDIQRAMGEAGACGLLAAFVAPVVALLLVALDARRERKAGGRRS